MLQSLMFLFLCAAPADGIPVEVTSAARALPVVIETHGKQTVWYGGKDVLFPIEEGKEVQKPLILPLGKTDIYARNLYSGFPQPVEYKIHTKNGVRWESGICADHPMRLFLEKDDVKVEVYLTRHIASYNSFVVKLPGKASKIYGVIGCARPYNFDGILQNPFSKDAPEEYPNGPFFLADPKWGVSGVAKDLVRVLREDQTKGAKMGNHRGHCHWGYQHQLNADGTMPKELIVLSDAELQKAIEDAITFAITQSCYRPFPKSTVDELKKAGFIPKDWTGKVLTVGDAVTFSKDLYGPWKEKRKKEKEESGKK